MPPGGVTYAEHIAPLLGEHCVGCHREGSIAPFALTDYESARAYGSLMAHATREREMPPMPVDNSGQCNTYANARWLTEGEIARIQAWVDAGAPPGDTRLAPPLPPPPAALADVNAEIGLAGDYVPRHGDHAQHDDYRCFVLPAPSDADAFVTAYEVVPGDARVVHHVIAFQPSSDAAAERARQLDAGEAGDGYTCFGGPGVAAELFAGWGPGGGPTEMPTGTGVPLAGGREVVLQVHYNLAQGAHPDRTRVRLRLAPRVQRPGRFVVMADQSLSLPPGLEHVEASSEVELDLSVPVTVHGAMPHMHELGRTLRVEAEARGQSACLVDVDRWNFHWQNAWWYEEPLELAGVDALSIRCGYDTRSRSDVVTWGEGTADEMCLSFFYVTSPLLSLF